MQENQFGVFDKVQHKSACTITEASSRGMKFWLYIKEELYYPSSENKGADRLRSYCRSAPLFLHSQKSGFLMTRLK